MFFQCSAVQQDNTDGPTVSLPHAQPPNHSSIDVTSIVARCAQLEQENNELRAEKLALEQKIETFNSSVQRSKLSQLINSQVVSNVYLQGI